MREEKAWLIASMTVYRGRIDLDRYNISWPAKRSFFSKTWWGAGAPE